MRTLVVSVGMSIWLLGGCATSFPQGQGGGPIADISVADVQHDAPRFLGQRVRWGGTVLAVHHETEVAKIELLSRPLASNGAPLVGRNSDGRFLAELKGPVDPHDYPAGSLLTVSGRLLWVEPRPVGNARYTYPVVVADAWHVWPSPIEPSPTG